MNNIYVLDQSFTLQGIIDEYVSIIWRPAYYEVGDFEIYVGATHRMVDLLRRNWYVVRSSDVTVESDGTATYRKVMVIKNIQLVTDVENGDFLTVTGRELKFLLHQRIVWNQTNLSGTAENAVRRLITENAISPTDSARVIPTLTLAPAAGLSASVDKQVTGTALDQAITEICKPCNYGWDVYISGGKLVAEVYAGVDRSYSQTERPYVVFSDEFENLYNTSYQLASEEYAGTTLIGGEGEGAARKYTAIGTEASGLDRCEVFTDARDISQNLGTDEAISDEAYILLLQERGRETLAEFAITEGFSGEVLSDVAFQYERDFFLGDVVTVINSYGIERNARVLSAIESEDEEGKRLVPQFNI